MSTPTAPTTASTAGTVRWTLVDSPLGELFLARDEVGLVLLHLPTGRVSIEALARFLVDDLDVVPLRDDWREVIDAYERQFWELRTWA